MGRIEAMIGLGVELWNDSCDVRELADAVAHGAVGATSNPVIVAAAAKGDPERWNPCLHRLARERPGASDEALAWAWVDAMVVEASRVLSPIFDRSRGAQGILNVQVDPELARDPAKMIEHARHLAALAPNLAIKVPLTKEGLIVLEELTALGIRTNATVSFSVPQALAAAQAIERGHARRGGAPTFSSYVTIMVGRVADHLKRVQDAQLVLADPGVADWAGVAIFKRAYALFRQRGFSSVLVEAAYRHRRQWTELIGEGVIQSIPYKWWKAFDASDVRLARTIEEPVPEAILDELVRRFPDFVRAYDEGGMRPEEFARYGASVATLRQFEAGYRELVDHVRTIREAA